MPLRQLLIGITAFLVLLGSQQACDFRQMIEDRPVKLPEESTKPKETHAAEINRSADPGSPARTR
jgi:hypothetical protein